MAKWEFYFLVCMGMDCSIYALYLALPGPPQSEGQLEGEGVLQPDQDPPRQGRSAVPWGGGRGGGQPQQRGEELELRRQEPCTQALVPRAGKRLPPELRG